MSFIMRKERGEMYTGVPASISEKVLELCERINPNARPDFIAISPEAGCRPAECFFNVQRKVQKEGGRIQYGWALWEWPAVFIEAEHHAIYEPPVGSPWRDITPCLDNSKKRLFLPDDSATYDFENEGIRQDNHRLAISDDPLIEEFFKAAKKRSAFFNDLPGVGAISINASESRELEKIDRRLSRATDALGEKYGTQS
jgi:hypothetical protein